jgi:hypothetical protein
VKPGDRVTITDSPIESVIGRTGVVQEPETEWVEQLDQAVTFIPIDFDEPFDVAGEDDEPYEPGTPLTRFYFVGWRDTAIPA